VAWSLVASTQINSVAGSTTAAINTTGADLIVICSGGWLTAAPTDNHGNTYLLAVDQNSGSVRPYSYIWYCHNPVAGSSHTFTFANSAQTTAVMAFSGSTTSSTVLDKTGAGYVLKTTSATSFPTSSITPAQSGALVIATWGIDDPAEAAGYGGFSVNNGFTIGPGGDESAGSYFGCVTAYGVQSSTAPVSCTLTRATALTQTGQSYAIVSFFGAATSQSYTLTASSGSLALTGENIVINKALSMALAKGLLSLTGGVLSTAALRKMAAAYGTFAETGEAISVTASRHMAVVFGAFTLAGEPAVTGRGRGMSISAGSFSYAGYQWAEQFQRRIAAVAGSFGLLSQSATLSHTRLMTAAATTFSWSGGVQAVGWARHMAGTPTAFALTTPAAGTSYAILEPLLMSSFGLTGKPIGTSASRHMASAFGTFALSGVGVATAAARFMAAVKGVFSLTTENATLSKNGSHQYGLTAALGSYGVLGKAISTAAARKASLSAGTFGLAGKAVATSFARHIAAVNTTFSLSGGVAAVNWRHVFGVLAGTFGLNGEPVITAANRKMSAVYGVFTLSGEAQLLNRNHTYLMSVTAGVFGLTGKAAPKKITISAEPTQFIMLGVYVNQPANTKTVSVVGYQPRPFPQIPGGEAKYLKDELASIAKAIQAANAALHTINGKLP
jgi:hypothetical protein